MVHDLWDQLADSSPSHVDCTLARLLDAPGVFGQADNVFWAVVVRVVDGGRAAFDHELGWRVHTIEARRPPSSSEAHGAFPVRALGARAKSPSDSLRRRSRAAPASFGYISSAAARARAESQVVKGGRQTVSGRLRVVFPVAADMESCFILERTAPQAVFR